MKVNILPIILLVFVASCGYLADGWHGAAIALAIVSGIQCLFGMIMAANAKYNDDE